MQLLTQILKQINNLVWGLPLICLLLGTGIYFTFKLRLIQLTKLKLAFKCIFKKHEGEGDVSSFQALCTALSSTIGTGNIVGVATAIAAGGPGALFLDVGISFLWYGYKICGRITCDSLSSKR